MPTRASASASALILMVVLSGCAAYEKCGLAGCAGDAKLASSVQAAFEQHAELEPPNLIRVQAVNGVVYLYGLVDTDYQRQMAAEVAHQASGAAKIINSIGLNNGSR